MGRSSPVCPLNYSTVLRCIAQDLQLRGIRSLDIRREGNLYVVRGGYQPAPANMPVTLHYSPADIDELDRLAQEQRGKPLPPQEFINLVQILRAIGGYLDNHQALFIRVSNNESPGPAPLFQVEYLSKDGEHVIDDRAGAAIYDMCVTMYKQRGRAGAEVLRRASGGKS